MRITTCKKNKNKGREGAALGLVLILVLVFSLLSLGLLSLARYNALETASLLNRTKAIWMAESGLNELRSILFQKKNLGLLENFGLVSVDEDSPVLNGRVAEAGSYTVYVRSFAGGVGRVYEVESVGYSINTNVVASVWSLVRPQTNAKYTYGSDDENKNIYTTGDRITGPFHTNGKLKISGKPEFNGQVSSSSKNLSYKQGLYRGGNKSTYVDGEVFKKGLQLRAEKINFDSELIANMYSDAEVLDGSYQVVIHDNEYILREMESSGQWGSPNTNDIVNIKSIGDSSDNILYFTGDVEVHGQVGGALTIASEGIIKITGDIIYSSAPDPNYENWAEDFVPDSDERMGLYSQKKVEVDIFDDPNTPAVDERMSRDVNIHAAIFVTKPQKDGLPENFNPGFSASSWEDLIGEPSINLYGSIVQHTRGKIGTVEGGGYLKSYHNDPRFLVIHPPGSSYGIPDIFEWKLRIW